MMDANKPTLVEAGHLEVNGKGVVGYVVRTDESYLKKVAHMLLDHVVLLTSGEANLATTLIDYALDHDIGGADRAALIRLRNRL